MSIYIHLDHAFCIAGVEYAVKKVLYKVEFSTFLYMFRSLSLSLSIYIYIYVHLYPLTLFISQALSTL